MRHSPYTQDYNALRVWLKAQREAKGLTLRQAGERVGRHHSVIGKLEQNRRRIDIAEFIDYCLSLGFDPHEGLEVLIRAHQRRR